MPVDEYHDTNWTRGRYPAAPPDLGKIMHQDRELFGGRFLPTTLSISFLNAPLDRVVSAFIDWHKNLNIPVLVKKFNAGFRGSAPELEPLVYRGQSKFLIVQSENPD